MKSDKLSQERGHVRVRYDFVTQQIRNARSYLADLEQWPDADLKVAQIDVTRDAARA